MFEKYLMTTDYGYNGVYRAKLISVKNDKDIRAYIPGINSINPFNEDGSINDDVYEKHKAAYPVVQWCCYNLESKEVANIEGPAWVMFENGDIKRPVCISYAVIGGGGGASSADGSNGSSDGSFSTASGNGVINIQGDINDEACSSRREVNTKYKYIQDVPQFISMEWTISGCLSEINKYAAQSAGSNSIAPVAKAINANGGASSTYISELNKNVVTFGNAILCATTNKFGVDGDFLWAHFTDNTELLFLRFDEKSSGNGRVWGPADTANEWGHWSELTSNRGYTQTWNNNKFNGSDLISILEICGVNSNTKNKTCDYIVNLGVNIKNDASFAKKSMSDIKAIVQQKITTSNNGGSSSDKIEKAIQAWKNTCEGKGYGRGSNLFDCSSSTAYAFIQAGILSGSHDDYTTGNAIEKYTQAGFVKVTSSVGTSSYTNLKRGDVLWSSGHMCIYLGNGKITKSNSKSGNVEGNWYQFATEILRYGG